MPSSTNAGTQTSAGATSGLQPAIQVSALELYDTYHTNEVSVDATYKDELLEVGGLVTSINRDFMGQPYLLLLAKDEFSNVHSTFPMSAEVSVSRKAKGDFVTLRCRGTGMILGSPVLNDCALR